MEEKLYDEMGQALKEGQTVVVAVSEAIACKAVIEEIDVEARRVLVVVHWPTGTLTSKLCQHYGCRDGKYFMSQIVVLL